MSMKKLWAVAAVTFQVVAVAVIAVNQEWVLATGEEVVLQTAPVDPRDIFRGDYVRLDYLFSNVTIAMMDENMLDNGVAKGSKVYLSLKRGSNGLSRGERLSLTPPASGHYLLGRTKSTWPYKAYKRRTTDDAEASRRRLLEGRYPLAVKYGIEQYFVEQGSGKAMEKLRGNRNGFQVPMLVHVALSGSGKAVIRSYEWANIAMKTEVLRAPKRDAPDDESSAVMRFTIKNRSSNPIVLPWKENHCSFALVPVNTLPEENRNLGFGRDGCEDAAVGEKTLAPEETVSVDFDLNKPQWYVEREGKQTPMGRLPWNYSFRIIHENGDIQGINARILSRAFRGRGNID